MDIQLKRGLLEACILAALYRKDSWGYQIIKDASEHVEISESTLYPILRRPESGGSLSVFSQEYNGRLRKYYKITPEGKQKLRDFLDDWQEVTKAIEYIKSEMEMNTDE